MSTQMSQSDRSRKFPKWSRMSRFRRPFLGLAALLFAGVPSTSMPASLIGITVQNQVGGAAMVNVQITAEGSNVARTDSTGRFRLNFTRGPGELAKLRVNHPGWVVVNETQLSSPLPANPHDHEVEILLAKVAEREQWALVFYRLRTREIVEAQYQAQLRALADRQQQNEQELAKLRDEKQRALGNAEALARQLAQANGKAGTAAVSLALRLIGERKVNEAFEALEDHVLDAEALEALEKRNNAADGFALRANLRAVRDFNFAGAEADYKKAVATAPDRFEVLLPFAIFLQELNRFSAADEVYSKAAKVARQRALQEGLALSLNNLGVIKVNRDLPVEALAAYEEALKIRRTLAAQQPAQYLPSVAATLNNLGNLHRREGRIQLARSTLEESLSIRRELARRNEGLYGAELAKTLANRGSVARDEKRLTDAIQFLSEAIELQRRLAPVSSTDMRPDLSRSLNNLGAMYAQAGEHPLAFNSYNEALLLRRFLATRNPEAFRPDVATTLLNLGLLQKRANAAELARATLQEAVGIFSELSAVSPEAYRVDLATSYAALAQVEESREALTAASLAAVGFDLALTMRPEDKVIRRSLYDTLRILHRLQIGNGDQVAADHTMLKLGQAKAGLDATSLEDELTPEIQQRGKSINLPTLLSTTRNLKTTPLKSTQKSLPGRVSRELCALSSLCGH